MDMVGEVSHYEKRKTKLKHLLRDQTMMSFTVLSLVLIVIANAQLDGTQWASLIAFYQEIGNEISTIKLAIHNRRAGCDSSSCPIFGPSSPCQGLGLVCNNQDVVAL